MREVDANIVNEQEQYMKDFLDIYEALECWGPGSEGDTTEAYDLLDFAPQDILEVGCGNGLSTLTLAALSNGHITATDNSQSALNKLTKKVLDKHLGQRVTTQNVSMTELGFDSESFDLIWSEASIYVMGVENALVQWKPLLKENGMLVFSDLVWLTDSPSDESKQFWESEYPDMQGVSCRLRQIENAGYQVKATFTMSEFAWRNYYEPLQQRLVDLGTSHRQSQALLDIQKEINLCEKYLGEFGYQFFIAQKCA